MQPRAAQSFREKLLFTHHGLSGPAILQASSYWRLGECVTIDLLPGLDIAVALREARAQGNRAEIRAWLAQHLPKSLATRWAEFHGTAKPIAMWSDREIESLSAGLHKWRITPSGTAGFEKAEVTAGGVDTDELSSKTFETRTVPRPLLHRRSTRRYRPPGRLQFPMGLGIWILGGSVRLMPILVRIASTYDFVSGILPAGSSALGPAL